MAELKRYIKEIKHKIKQKSPTLKKIKNLKMFYNTLKEIDQEIIGNNCIKNSIAKQTRVLVIRMNSTKKNKDPPMLNTVFYGPPGTGKTTLGCKLAKLWQALGLIEAQRSAEPQKGQPQYNPYGNAFGGYDIMTIYIMLAIFYLIFAMIIFPVCKWCYTTFPLWVSLVLLAIITVIFIIIAIYTWRVYYSGNSSSNSSTNQTTDKPTNSGNPKNTSQNADNTTEKDANVDEKNDEKDEDEEVEEQTLRDIDLVEIVSREHFVSKFVGNTDKQTLELLNRVKREGKVLFIDEAYNLITGTHDQYGREATGVLVRFLSENPGFPICIAGYKKDLQDGLFQVQPGFARRFSWHFECDGYSPDEIYRIFVKQAEADKWKLLEEESEEIMYEIMNNADAFPAYGGDTKRLLNYAQTEYYSDCGEDDYDSDNRFLSHDHIARGIVVLRENNINNNSEKPRLKESDLIEFLTKARH